MKLVPPRDLGPTSYAVDYPPKKSDGFEAAWPYVPAPMVSLEKTTSYELDYPRKVGEAPRIPDREYRELNPAEPVPAGSTSHAHFPGHMPNYPIKYAAPEVPLPPCPTVRRRRF